MDVYQLLDKSFQLDLAFEATSHIFLTLVNKVHVIVAKSSLIASASNLPK